jgi:hypothetical protein
MAAAVLSAKSPEVLGWVVAKGHSALCQTYFFFVLPLAFLDCDTVFGEVPSLTIPVFFFGFVQSLLLHRGHMVTLA